MTEATFTFRVDEALKLEFARAAKARDRTGAQLLRDFMRDFVREERNAAEYDAWFHREVQHGIADADAGDVEAHVDVEARFAARREALHRRVGSQG